MAARELTVPYPFKSALVVAVLSMAACAYRPGGDPPTSFASVLERASPAVVGIADLAADRLGGDDRGDAPVAGSGFRIERTNLVATAAHVVAALHGPPVVVWNARRWTARVHRVDEQADLALLEIDAAAPMPGLALAEGSSDSPGAWVLVLGRPFGTSPTATVGIISARPGAVLRPESLRGQMQLNAAVNPGNSGGPVLNLEAKVVGVANATVPGGYGLGFAVPVAALRALLERR